MENFPLNHNSPASDSEDWGQGEKSDRRKPPMASPTSSTNRTSEEQREGGQGRQGRQRKGRQEENMNDQFPMPNDATCFKPGNPSNAVAPPCPMPHAPCPMPDFDSTTPKTQLLIYLIPVVGVFPSLWTLYRRQGNREQIATSRLSITLAFTWFLAYLLLATGAETSEFLGLRLLILNSFLTSGYFLVSLWLMLRVIQRKSRRLPGFSRLAERVLGKY